MFTVDRKYWLLGIAAGVGVGLVAMLVTLQIGDRSLMRDESLIMDGQLYLYVESALNFVGPALFGAVFVYCLRSTTGTDWWRGLCLLSVIVAAHNGALGLAVNAAVSLGPLPGLPVGVFTYGATFAFVVATVAALLFPPARGVRLVAVTVLASGLVALGYFPLEAIVPYRGFFISQTAAWVTFGLVYAVVAALLGWRLFEKKTVTDAAR